MHRAFFFDEFVVGVTEKTEKNQNQIIKLESAEVETRITLETRIFILYNHTESEY